ncbi:MAG: alpha/beta hydrolase [Planctomycetota bacterium]|jgi:pimeloyl-ACP methyl ester carboxylesterase
MTMPFALIDYVSRHWAAIAIAVTLVSLLVFLVLLMAKYVRICLNIFIDTPPPLSMGPVDFQRLIGQEVRFRSFDGTSLRGMLIRCPNRNDYRGTIVFCHEYGSDMFSCARYVRPLIDNGFDIFTFDFRGHGESSNRSRYRPLQWPSDKELEDILGATAHVEAMLAAEGKPTEIGLFGISRGAGAGLLAASSDPNIKAIVCDGAFCTNTTLIALMKRWAHIFARVKLVYDNHSEKFWRFLLWLFIRFAQPRLGCRYPSVSRALKEMQPRPIFFVHGQKDSYIRVDQTEYLWGQAPTPKYLWVVPEAKHNQSVIVQPGQYAARTVAFFRKHLAGEAIGTSTITSPDDSEAVVA